MGRSLFLLSGGIVVSAFVVSPALEIRDERTLSPVPVASRIPILAPATSPSSIPAPDPADARSKSRNSQTMGTGSVDVALDAGEDPFAGIGEEGEYEEPVDELAGMTVAERAAAQRAALNAAGEDEPEDAGEPDDPRDDPGQETPGEEDPFAGIGEGEYTEPVDEWATMTIEERTAATRAYLEAPEPNDPRDAQDDLPPPEEDPPTDDEDPFAGIGEHEDDEPLDEWLAMSPLERAEATRKALDDAADDGDDAAAAPQNSTLRTPPEKDPRAAAYDAQVQSRFAEVEQVRQRSNPPGAPLDPSGIAPVVSGEGRQLQESLLDPGLDAPLRDSRGTEVTRSTVLGLILIRDMYIAMANAMANVFDTIREGDLAFKRDRAQAIYQAAREYDRIWSEAEAAKIAYESELTAPRNLMSAEEVQQLNAKLQQFREAAAATGAALVQATDQMQKSFPEIFVTIDGVPLWKAMTLAPGGEGVEAGLERVQIYNSYLERGAADLRSRAAAALAHDTTDELMEYGRPEYANMRNGVRLDGRSVGSELPDLLMNQVEAIRAAYDIHVAVDKGWTRVILALTPVGAIAGGWFFLPFSAVAYTCLGASIVGVALEGHELVVTYGEAQAAEQAGPILGWRHVMAAQDRQRAATGGFVLAAVGVAVDTAVVRSIRIVGPSQCSGAIVQQVGDAVDAARAGGAARITGLRPDDIAHWRQVEADEIVRARGYGHVLEDATDAKLAQLDEAVLAAERAGVPRSVIDDGLNRIRDTRVSGANDLEREAGVLTPFDHAIRDFRIRMVIAEAMQKGFTIVSRIEDTAYLAKLGGSQAKIVILEPGELNQLIAKVATDRVPGSVTYTPKEADLARQILNEDATKLYVFDPMQVEGGLYRLMDGDDLENLRQIFGPNAARPATIVDAPPTGPPPDLPPRQVNPEADTHLDVGRAAGEDTQVLRPGEADELPPDAPTVRLPAHALEEADRTPTQVLRLDEIGEYPLDAPTVRFPAGALDEADRTPTQVLRAGEVEDAALGAETVRLERAACPRTGPCGPNEIIAHGADPAGFIRWHYGKETRAADAYDIAVRELGAENVDGIAGGYAQGRARVWSWPEGTSYLDAKRMDKFGGQLYDPEIVAKMPTDVQQAYAKARELGSEGLPSDLDIPVTGSIDAGRLNDVAKKIYDETGVLIEFTESRIRDTARAAAPQAGVRLPEVPPSVSAVGPPPLSELDKQVIQKAFQHGRGERVVWTADELTRLQQIAYPPSGARPTAVQRKMMPVAEELGGQLKTLRANADDFGAVIDEANQGFLAHQEMEDLMGLAGRAGVPPERVRLLTGGLDEKSPVTALERASRGLLRAIDEARGIIHESGIPDDYFVVNRIYVAAKGNGSKLTPEDVEFLRAQLDVDEGYIGKLSQREFEDALGEPHTIMDPAAAEDLEGMYRAATGGQAAAPVSQAPPATINLASGEAASMIGGPSGRGGTAAPVEIVILSTTGSTGPVMEAFFLNKGMPVHIQGEGIVLEPVANVDAATMRRIDEIREAALQGKPVPSNEAGGPGGGGGPLEDSWTGASVVRVVLDAYCLQADLDVPTQGLLFRIADAPKQAEFGDLPAIIDASQQLHDRGALHPSGNPEDYFHSIRQWAVWAEEKDMDAEAFEDAFVDHARRNITAAGQPWNADVEEVVREYAPGRWRDVEAVLDLAGVR